MIRVPGFRVPASGLLTYRYLITRDLFPKDVWVRAAEFRIDQRSVVHHINAYARGPESSYLAGYPKGEIVAATIADRGRRREGERVFDRRLQLVGWEPGYQPCHGCRTARSRSAPAPTLCLRCTTVPNGKEVTDYSELGIYLTNAAPSQRVLAIDTLRDLDLAIPAGAPDYVSRASMTLAQTVKLVSVQPHMHRRGKSMEVRAVYPDGRTRLLVSVPKYDFNWQTTYVLREPLLLPAGTRLESVAHFDNSVNNPANPDPSVPVRWGDMTTDEMHIAFPRTGDANRSRSREVICRAAEDDRHAGRKELAPEAQAPDRRHGSTDPFLQRTQLPHSFFCKVDRHEYVVMIGTRDDIATDAGVPERRRECGSQPNGLQI